MKLFLENQKFSISSRLFQIEIVMNHKRFYILSLILLCWFSCYWMEVYQKFFQLECGVLMLELL